ncbi:MAG: lytic transglycosylase domain-containing protein, partial [Planctomycetes bacterium]|nr:lytic transglycosylase domain-containing protein [Planctomycetota bacterium]
RMASAESRYSPDVKNPRSTAGGVFQIIDDTWKRYGGAPGKKYDVDENIRVGTDIIADNMGRMRKVLNREPSYSEVYAAHFFGPDKAKAVINSAPDTTSDKILSAKVLRDNPNLQNKTTSEIMAMLDRKVNPRARSAPPAPRGPAASEFAAPGRADPMLLTQAAPSAAQAALPNVPRETMLAALGPNYQAAMALTYLSGSTGEDDSDLQSAKERIAADKESARSPGMEWLTQESRPSPFASLDLTASTPFAAPVARMKDGGDVSKKEVSPLSERFDLGKAGEFDPIGNAKKTLQGVWETAKKVPGNLQALVTDPVAYAKSLPEPSAAQLLNALGPSNVGGPFLAGIMKGPRAQTWDAAQAQAAYEMMQKGQKAGPTWEQTGTNLVSKDTVPRQEINDSNAKFRVIPPDKLKAEKNQAVQMVDWIDRQLSSRDSGNMSMGQRQQLLNVRSGLADKIVGLSRDPYTEGMPAKYMLEHPELYAAYPQLADTNIRLYRGNNGFPGAETAGAYWDRNNNAVNINEAMLKDPRFNPRLAALHEMQHAVQDIEGMSQGTNPNAYKYDMDNFLKFYEKRIDDPKLTQQKATELAKEDWYRAHQGEAEARQTTDRADMTEAERRSTFPEYDIPPDMLLSPPNPNFSYGGAVHRADGSPPEGEKPQVDNTASAKAAAMLRGFGDSAYSIAGAPVDLATMGMRLVGYNAEK